MRFRQLYLKDEGKELVYCSDFQELHSRTVTLDLLLTIADSAKKALAWLVRQNKFKDIETATRMVEGGIFITEIDFTFLTGEVKRIEVIKYPQYWKVVGEL